MNQLVILESPYSGKRERNIAYTQRAMSYLRERGYIVVVPHMMWTQHHLAPRHYVGDWDEKYFIENYKGRC